MHHTPNQRFKEYFAKHRVAQVDAARAMKIDRVYLNQVLNGVKPINAYFLWRFWVTYAWEKSSFFLADAHDMLSDFLLSVTHQ